MKNRKLVCLIFIKALILTSRKETVVFVANYIKLADFYSFYLNPAKA